MAEEKKRKITKKEPEEGKAAQEEPAAFEEKVTEEPVEKAEEAPVEPTAETQGQEVEEEPGPPPEEGEERPIARVEDLKKPLEKMTAKELREVALGIPGISGVHAMKKEELLVAIRKAWGIEVEKAPKKAEKEKAVVNVAELKAKIREIKAKRAEAIQKKDKRMARIYRRKINRLKKRTRRAA